MDCLLLWITKFWNHNAATRILPCFNLFWFPQSLYQEYLLPIAITTDHYWTGWFKTTEINYLVDMGARNLNLECRLGLMPSLGITKSWSLGHMHPRIIMSGAQHKTKNFLKILGNFWWIICSSFAQFPSRILGNDSAELQCQGWTCLLEVYSVRLDVPAKVSAASRAGATPSHGCGCSTPVITCVAS